MQYVATKSFRYNGKALKPGDTFEISNNRDGKMLVGIRKAREVRAEVQIPAPSAGLAGRIQRAAAPSPPTGSDDDALRERLRADYKRKFGRAAWHGWTVGQLEEKLAGSAGS